MLQLDELKAYFHACMLQVQLSAYGDSRQAPTAGMANRSSLFCCCISNIMNRYLVFATEDEIKKSKEKMKKKWDEFLEIVRAQV